jgi:hypothetical protein
MNPHLRNMKTKKRNSLLDQLSVPDVRYIIDTVISMQKRLEDSADTEHSHMSACPIAKYYYVGSSKFLERDYR